MHLSHPSVLSNLRLYDLAKDAIFVLDTKGYIVDISRAVCERLGYSKPEMLGNHFSEFNSPESAEKISKNLAELKLHEKAVFETTHMRKDGKPIPCEVNARIIKQYGVSYIIGVVRDITEQKEIEEIRLVQSRIYVALLYTNRALLESKTEIEIYNRICQIAVEYGEVKLAWVGKVDEESKDIETVVKCGEAEAYLDGIRISASADVPEGHGPTATAFREQSTIIVQNFSADPLTLPWHERADKYGLRASASLSIMRGGKSHAVITFYFAQANTFDREIIELLEEMARNIGFALERFDLEQERIKTLNELRIAASVFESQEAMLVTDASKKIIRVNKAFTDVTGYASEEVVGKDPCFLQTDRYTDKFYQEIWKIVDRFGFWQGELWDKRKNGEEYPKLLTISAVKDNYGHITNYVRTFVDLKEQKEAQDRIERLAFYDQLTGLPNRRLALERLEHALVASERKGNYGAIIYLDVDHFNVVNDTLGHDAGDTVLVEVAHVIQNELQLEDTVARLGGDEFVAILEDFGKIEDHAAKRVKSVADKLLKKLDGVYTLHGLEFSRSVSIGISLFIGMKYDFHEILKQSDLAMYAAKKAGRNTIRFFDPLMQEALEKRAFLEQKLRRAVEQGQFALYFQKRVYVTHEVSGAEVLLRWMHPVDGIISPQDFIPLAEETGMIVQIGMWVLKEACRCLSSWRHRDKFKDLTLSINVSAVELKQPNFVNMVRETVAQSKIDPSRLILEITESMLLENMDDFVVKMEQIRDIGIVFALDDFGTGYSSLSYLKKLPISELKIDKSFISDIGTNKNDDAIVQTIIQMGHTLGIEVIAEGVETQEQCDILKMYNCNNYQGYLFGRPVTLSEYEKEFI